jgi:hypothetical protein
LQRLWFARGIYIAIVFDLFVVVTSDLQQISTDSDTANYNPRARGSYNPIVITAFQLVSTSGLATTSCSVWPVVTPRLNGSGDSEDGNDSEAHI